MTASNDPGDSGSDRQERLREEIEAAERKIELIRGKQREYRDWERSRRPIRIGFFVVIPIVLAIEGVHLYRTIAGTQGSARAPWIMIASVFVLALVSWWYYRQARTQRDRILGGYRRAGRFADDLETRVEVLKRELEQLRSSTGC